MASDAGEGRAAMPLGWQHHVRLTWARTSQQVIPAALCRCPNGRCWPPFCPACAACPEPKHVDGLEGVKVAGAAAGLAVSGEHCCAQLFRPMLRLNPRHSVQPGLVQLQYSTVQYTC